MQCVATSNGLPLQQSTSESGLEMHTWKAVMAYDGSWTGRVVVQLASAQEVYKLHDSLHGKGVEIQHHLAGIMVDSEHLDLGNHEATTRAQAS